MPESIAQLVATAAGPAADAPARGAEGAPSPRRVRAAARLMSTLENQPQRLPELFKALADHNLNIKPRLLLGITGAPGSGKSTLTDALVAEHRRRFPGEVVGVLAVDPSSPFTGGAVLGDRVRMMRHASDPFVFVRSLATRGHLGGLSLGVKAVARVMALLGCRTIILETVGVGQSEVEVTKVADHVLVVLAPGQGDSIQMLKAGLMEIGDGFVVNKADRDGASTLYAQLISALRLSGRPIALASSSSSPIPPGEGGSGPPEPGEGAAGHHGRELSGAGEGKNTLSPALSQRGRGPEEDPNPDAEPMPLTGHAGQGPVDVFLVSAAEGRGVADLFDRVTCLTADRQEQWTGKRDRLVNDEVREAVLEEARRRVSEHLGHNGTFTSQVQRILRGEVTVARLAEELITKTAGESGCCPPPPRGEGRGEGA